MVHKHATIGHENWAFCGLRRGISALPSKLSMIRQNHVFQSVGCLILLVFLFHRLYEKWFESSLQRHQAKYKKYFVKSLSERIEMILSLSLSME